MASVPVGSADPPLVGDRDIDLRYYAGLVWRHRVFLTACAAVGLLVGLVVALVQTPEYQRLNPNALVPAGDDGEGEERVTLWESNVIVRYLCAKHSMGRWSRGSSSPIASRSSRRSTRPRCS